jgi:hypothetical protein
MIHATRAFLLNDFTDLSRRPPVPHPEIASHVQKCIAAAEDAMTLVDSLVKQGIMIQSFWFTHYVCFCAIIVVYIYTIQQHRQSSGSAIADSRRTSYLFTLAETCQQHLAEATRKNCPSRRYGIILEELRREVHRQIGDHPQSGQLINPSDDFPARSSRSQEPDMDQRNFTSAGVNPPITLESNNPMNYPTTMPSELQPSALTEGPFDPNADYGLLDNLEGSIWWAHLDSWVSALVYCKT